MSRDLPKGVPRSLRGAPKAVPGAVMGALGGPEEVPGWLMRPMGGAGQPMGNLDLRFPMFLSHLSIWTYVI